MSADPIWTEIRTEAQGVATREAALRNFLELTVLSRSTLEDALANYLSRKFGDGSQAFPAGLFLEAFNGDADVAKAVRRDLAAVRDRDPACCSLLPVFLYMKGFLAISCHRLAHYLWTQADRKDLALYLQSLVSEIYTVDIHPAARFGNGILLDHATGFVAGETSVVEDDVSILHAVTLGGTGKEQGDRHPKVRRACSLAPGRRSLAMSRLGKAPRLARVVWC